SNGLRLAVCSMASRTRPTRFWISDFAYWIAGTVNGSSRSDCLVGSNPGSKRRVPTKRVSGTRNPKSRLGLARPVRRLLLRRGWRAGDPRGERARLLAPPPQRAAAPPGGGRRRLRDPGGLPTGIGGGAGHGRRAAVAERGAVSPPRLGHQGTAPG